MTKAPGKTKAKGGGAKASPTAKRAASKNAGMIKLNARIAELEQDKRLLRSALDACERKFANVSRKGSK